MVTLGLSVGRGAIEPQSARVKLKSLVNCKYTEADVFFATAGYNILSLNGKIIIFLSGSESVARLT